MGLASKLAAAQGGATAVANYASQQQRPQGQAPPGQQGSYPGQQQPYQAYNSGPQGAPPPQQYGAPPQQQQHGQYGAPPPQQSYGGPGGPPGDAPGYQRELERAVQEKNLNAFYGPGTPGSQRIPQIAARAVQQVDRLCQAWRIQKEIANDIIRLSLYDVIIYVDDSGSMSFEENGERIKDLQLILQRTAFAATLFDEDGIEVRFMNDDSMPANMLSGIRDDSQIEQMMRGKRFNGVTPFGTKLREKVLDPLVISKMRSRTMQKPVLVIGITDGQPSGESANALSEAVRYAYREAQGSAYGPGAISFQFAQVGNDAKATEFLAKLDNDPEVGRLVDCTSNYENESAEMARAQPPVDLTPDLWMIKLILGAIDPSYDTKDEKRNMAGGGGMPPGGPPPGQGGYGGPPQYGQAPPQYGGAPPQGQYNRPPPGPPPGQGGYGGQQQQQQGYGQQGGYPPQGQHGGYGAPPQQGGYGGQQQGGYGGQQQGGYGGAPPPPRY